jgi:Na+/serine symporter
VVVNDRYTTSLVLAVAVGLAIAELSNIRKTYKGSNSLIIKQTWKAFFLTMTKLANVYIAFLPVISCMDVIKIVQELHVNTLLWSAKFLYVTVTSILLYSLLVVPTIHFSLAGKNPYTIMFSNPVLLFVSMFCPNYTSVVVAVFWHLTRKEEPVRCVIREDVNFTNHGGDICWMQMSPSKTDSSDFNKILRYYGLR